jgi:hypothetical protein
MARVGEPSIMHMAKILRLNRCASTAYSAAFSVRESIVANKEQKRSSREAKKPKQKKKGAEKRPAGKGQTAKS